jgi:hypothetical protein
MSHRSKSRIKNDQKAFAEESRKNNIYKKSVSSFVPHHTAPDIPLTQLGIIKSVTAAKQR